MKNWKRLGVCLALAALLAAGCSSDDDTATANDDEVTESTAEPSTDDEASVDDESDAETDDETDAEEPDEEAPVGARPVVRVGSVNSLTGPVPFPEASAAAKAVFDRYNDDPGGLVTIEYVIEDDMADPAIASQAARKLVSDEDVVLMAGAASLVDCAVNGPFYAENNLYSVQGTGVDATCFNQSNISPVNTGPYKGLTVSLYFASEVLGHDSICYFQFDTGSGTDPYDTSIGEWTDLTGKELTLFEFYTPGDDFTPYVTRATELGCDAVFEGGLDVTAIAWDAAVAGQGASFDTMHFTSAYTQAAADGIGSPATPTYANSEFEPFGDTDSPALQDWVELMGEAGVPMTSFAEGGYIAGLAAIQILEAAELTEADDVSVQRDKIAASVLSMEPFENDMLGSAYEFGDAPAHGSNVASKFVQLVDGEWVTVTDEFIVLSELG